MARVPQDTGEERLIPEARGARRAARAAGAEIVRSDAARPGPGLRAAARRCAPRRRSSAAVERTPLVRAARRPQRGARRRSPAEAQRAQAPAQPGARTAQRRARAARRSRSRPRPERLAQRPSRSRSSVALRRAERRPLGTSHAIAGLRVAIAARAAACASGARAPLAAARSALSTRPPPAHAGPVDLLDRLVDLVAGAELVDGAPALLERPVVVDDQVAARPTGPGRARCERRPRRLVGVAVEPHDRPALAQPAPAACPRRSPGRTRTPRS